MRVIEIMMGTPYCCRPQTNLGSATELMWIGNCGFLPVVDSDEKVVGVITDRDICVALGTRGKPAGDILVQDVMSQRVFSCTPDDDIHLALRAMHEGRVRRLPVIAKTGKLVGVLSIDDVLLRTDPLSSGKAADLTSAEALRTFQAINGRQLPQVAKKSVGV